MKQYRCVVAAVRMFKLMLAALALGSFVNHALAAPCDLKLNPPPSNQRDLTGNQATSVSCCELCGGTQTALAVFHTGMTSVQYG